MRRWLRYLGGVVLGVGLLGLAVDANAESCSLELKKVSTTTTTAADALYRATYPHRFYETLSGNVHFGGEQDLPDFDEVIRKDRKKYNTETPVRGVLKLGTQHFGYVLDSSVRSAKEEADEDVAEDEEEEGGFLAGIANMFSGSQPQPKMESMGVVPYDRLYFDRDHDGDLSDEEVIEADSTRSNSIGSGSFTTDFGVVDATIEIDSKKLDYAFAFSVSARGSIGYSYVSGTVNAVAYREGEITLDGKKHHVVLLDFNSNGRFDDQPEIDSSVRMSNGTVYPTQGDRLYIDPDLKNVSRSPYGPALDDDLHEVGNLLFLEGRLYEMSVTPSGDKLTLTPSDTPVGYVSNPNPGFGAVVYGEQGFLKIRDDGSGKVPLPVGQWKLQAYIIDRTGMEKPETADAQPTVSLMDLLNKSLGPTAAALAPRSTMVSATATTDYKPVEVVEGKMAVMAFGPPYRPVVDVEYQSGSGQVSLGLTLIGMAGEVCTDLQVEGKQPSKPKFTIATADGQVVDEGEFEYG